MGALSITALGKAYAHYPSPWARLRDWLRPSATAAGTQRWVLRDINARIAAGEAVGIIGSNGAGKSTLLKLITGTTRPTEGEITVSGRVAALLELGLGFHPDFTGRENIRMAAQLMGIPAASIPGLMPEIERFADIGEHIDDPVRVYSSGMQMRLAFSVATCVRPDVLIVDEALAVGDVFFQQKCFDRIRQFIAAGTTLLFVSHSAGTIMSLCSRCLFIRDGRLVFDGDPKRALDLYQADVLGRPAGGAVVTQGAGDVAAEKPALPPHLGDAATRPALSGREGSIASDGADCVAVRFVHHDGSEQLVLLADQTVTLELDFRLRRDFDDLHAGFKIRNRYGVVLFETNSYCMGQRLGGARAGTILSVRFAFPLALFPDEYTITAGLGNGGHGDGAFHEILCYLHDVHAFTVLRNPEAITWAGVVNLQPRLAFTTYAGA